MAKTNFLKCPDLKTFAGYARRLVVNKVVPISKTGEMTVKEYYDLAPEKVKANIDRWVSEGAIKFEDKIEIKKLEKSEKPRKKNADNVAAN